VVTMIVVVVAAIVVDVLEEVEVVELVELVEVVDVDVVVPQGQFSSIMAPTATFKQMSASDAVVSPLPDGSQMQSGVQGSRPTATRRIYKQSVATGLAPADSG